MTNNQRWISRRYLVYRALTNMWFMGAVWLYFYRIYITDQQVGILDGLAFAIGLIAEVPSGALADRFGRSKIVRLGQVLIGSGLFMQAFGSGFMPFFVGQAITMVGASFASGADEALFFEKLNFKRDSLEWRKLLTRGSQASLMASVIALVVGGILHTVNPRLPWILTGFSFFIATVVIWQVKDDVIRKSSNKLIGEIKEYLHDIQVGFSQFRLPKLWLYVPIIVIVQGLFYAAGWGLLRLVLLDRFHFDPLWGSIAVATSSLITVAILAFMHKYADRMSEKRVITFISLSAAASLLLSLANIGTWGYVVILILYAGEHILYPFMSEVLNYHAPENQRATVLSVASFLRILPYVILAPIIGYLNTNGKLEYFLMFWTVLILIATLVYISNKKQDVQIKLAEE